MCKTCTTFSARPSLQNDMDGGVAAALIEKEAAACPDRDAHWRLDEAMETIQRLAKERDEARGALRARLGMSAPPRTLTPDDITDEMVERAHAAAAGFGTAADISASATFAMLTAALTEPPARPEGAAEIEALLWNGSEDDEMTVLDAEDRRLISNYLASRGVRVVTEEQQ